MIIDLNRVPPLFGYTEEVKAMRERVELRNGRAKAYQTMRECLFFKPFTGRLPEIVDHHEDSYREEQANDHLMFPMNDGEE